MLIIYILNFILLRIIIPNSNWKHHDKLTDYGRKENPYILILLMAFFPIFWTRGPAFHHALGLTLSPSENYPLGSPLPSFLPNALQVPLQHTLHPYLTGYCLPGMSLHFLKIWDLACHHSFSHSLFHHPPPLLHLLPFFGLTIHFLDSQLLECLTSRKLTCSHISQHHHVLTPLSQLRFCGPANTLLLLAFSCILWSSPVIWVFYYCLINYHNNSSLKQYTFIISEFQWVRGKA